MPSRSRVVRRIGLLLGIAAASSLAGCLHFFYSSEIKELKRPLAPHTAPTLVRASIRAHGADGSTTVFQDSAWIDHDSIWGAGQRSELLASPARNVHRVLLDSVLAVESFSSRLRGGPTVAVSLGATIALPIAIAGLAIAIFGSCPTVYADTGVGLALEAEGFSYAIAPMFEHRDVDRLRVQPDSHGVVRLELRNEALETHFINHIELVAVRHARNARVVPDQRGAVVAVDGFASLERAIDRSGRDVLPTVAERDGNVYSTAPSVVQNARAGDLEDWIDLDIGSLPPGDSLAVVLRLRNSLLNTILLYEGMLGGRDAPEWIDRDVQRISTAVDIGRWYTRTMGMRADVEGVAPRGIDPRDGIARLGDVGPIAFRDVAIVLPRAKRDAHTARVRLRFVADNWRIDEIRVVGHIAKPSSVTLPVREVIAPATSHGDYQLQDTAAVRALASADEAYLETRPSQRMSLVFERDRRSRATNDSVSTYLLAWQGWYREWIRASWLQEPTRTGAFVPGDSAVLTALRRWTDRKATFERDFYASRIPVR